MAWLFGQPFYDSIRSEYLFQDEFLANTTGHGDAWRLHDQIGPTPRVSGVSASPASAAGFLVSGGRRLAVPLRLFWLKWCFELCVCGQEPCSGANDTWA